MTVYNSSYQRHCFVPCSKDKVLSGACVCMSHTRIPDEIMDYLYKPPMKTIHDFCEEAAKDKYHNLGYEALKANGSSLTLHLCHKEAEIRFLRYQLEQKEWYGKNIFPAFGLQVEAKLSDGTLGLAMYDDDDNRTTWLIKGTGGKFWRSFTVSVESWRFIKEDGEMQ